jgi:HlyD family secretion protein
MTAPWRARTARLLRGRRRETGAATIALLLALLGTASLVVPGRRAAAWPTAVAREAPFVETLVEAGTIGAARLMLYGSRIAGGPAKIAELAREGTLVAPGDLLIRFDAAGFEQEIARETAALQQAKADRDLAREALRLEGLQARSDVDHARQQIDAAESELANQVDGAGKLELAEAEAAAAEAARETVRARSAVEDLKPMLAEGFITAIELERAEQALRRAIEQEKLAALRRETLARYARPAAVDRAASDVHAARESLARETDGAAARLAQRRAVLALAEGKVHEVEARLAILGDRLAHTVVRADSPGLVVYRDLFFGSDRRKPQVGDEAWPNQPIIALPDSSRLVVETRVREIDLHKVSASQRVHVTVDAYPGLCLAAVVELVGALAQDDAARAGTKFFPVTIALAESDARLRPGMTARVEIDVARLASAIVVPVQAVFDDGDRQAYCVVLRRGRPERRAIVLAAENGIEAAVREGLAAGDVVLLVNPFEERGGAADRP